MERADESELQAALPRALYVDPAAWATERERVLVREWTAVGRIEDLGLHERERVAVVDVLGESVLLTRAADGALHGAYNVCRHRGAQLFPALPGAAPTTCAVGALRCPYHSWTYALDGSLLRAPHAGDVDRSDFALRPVDVAEWSGFAFVRLDEGGAELADAVERPNRTLTNYAIGELATGSVLSYDVAANWKVIAENYNAITAARSIPSSPDSSRPSATGGETSTGTPACRTARARGPSPRRGPRRGRRCRVSTPRSESGTRVSWSIPT